MDICLLGAVEVRAGDGVLDAGPLRQRTVLAALAVDAGRTVDVATLVDRVWDEEPPAAVRPALYAYVSRLRRLGVRLSRQTGGYALQVDPRRVDLHRFRHLVAEASGAHRGDAERATLLRDALRLWTGVPLAGLPGSWAARMRASWQQERLDAVVRWAGVEMRLGRGAEVIGVVRDLQGEHPLAEPLVEVLMRALVAAGRNAEAVECYAAARARLAEQLGVEPGPRLQAVHAALLRGELARLG